MTPSTLKGIAIGCFIVCAVCIFIAYERYQDNASKVAAMKQMSNETPFGGMLGGADIQPATPAATKYALFFAVLSGGGGVGFLIAANRRPRQVIRRDREQGTG